MTEHPEITLRYFDARGRAQFLRSFMHAREIPFEDDRVPLDEGFASWQGIREDRSLSGPLQRLPVLQYGERIVPETIVIAAFLHRVSGDAATLGEDGNIQHDVLVSTCYVDLAFQIAMLLWSDLLFEGAELSLNAAGGVGRIARTLDVIEKAVTEWQWVARMHERPATVADCILWEALDQTKALLGSLRLLDDKPQLARLHSEHPARDAFERLLADRPCQITGRPGEEAVIEAIRGHLAGARYG